MSRTNRVRHELIDINDIVVNANTQARTKMCDEAVERYADVLDGDESGEWPFEHLVVFVDSSLDETAQQYILADGFHRLAAAKVCDSRQTTKKQRWQYVPCAVHTGNATAARVFSITANDNHGVPMTRHDKMANLRWVRAEFPESTQDEHARMLGVSVRTLQRMISDMSDGEQGNRPAAKAPKHNRDKNEKVPKAGTIRQVAESPETRDGRADDVDAEYDEEHADATPADTEEARHEEPAVEVYDALQRCVPAQHREAQAQAMRLITVGRLVDGIRTQVQNLSQVPGGAWLNVQQIDTAVRDLKRLITKAAYYTHCDTCNGTGRKGSGACKTCVGNGWIPEWLKEQTN